jgi:hypothetical protein
MSEMKVMHESGDPTRPAGRAMAPAADRGGAAVLCILLAGHRAMRPGISVAHELGIPVAALPIDADRSLAEAWDDAAARASIARRRLLALTDASERRYFERSRSVDRGESGHAAAAEVTAPASAREAAPQDAEPREGLLLRVDRADHRGAAGTVADLWDAEAESFAHAAGSGMSATRSAMLDGSGLCAEVGSAQTSEPSRASGAFVIEASAWPGFDLRGFAAAVAAEAPGDSARGGSEAPWACVGAAPSDDGADELRPAGVFYLSAGALRLVPRVGYFDLKEQLLAAIVGAGGRVRSWIGAPRFARVVGRESYLDAIRMRLESGANARADDIVLEDGAEIRGSTIACRGVRLGARSLVVDSAILPGARIGAGAIVARSVVPPGAFVPQGAFVVDQVFASFAGTQGGAR